MSKKDWTDQLPELFEGYTEAEPEGLWDAVQGAMAPKSKKAAAAWWWYGAAALAAAACVAVGVFLFRNDTTVIPSEGTTVISSEVEKSLAVVDVPDNPESEEELPCPGVDRPSDGSSETPDSSLSGKEDGSDPSCPTPIGHLEATNEEKGEENQAEVIVKEEEGNESEANEATKEEKKEEVKQTEAEKEWNDIINGKEEGSGKNNRTRKPTEVKLKVGASTGQYLAQGVGSRSQHGQL